MTESTRAGRREWIGLAVLVLPTLLFSIDISVLHLAVPKLSADLDPSATELLWINDVYGFLLAGFLITMGALGDRYGRRRVLLIGAAAFGLASVLAAYASSAEALIAARALLGVAGATLMPSTLSLIRTMFHDPAQRTTAISIWMTGFTGGMVAGPLVGGAMLEHFWWGSVFLLGVPVMALLLVAGPMLLPEYRDPEPGRIDLPSVALSLTGVLAMIYGLKELAAHGLGALPAGTLLAGVALSALFIRRQRRLAAPLLDLKLFAERRFSAALGTLLLVIMTGPGLFLLIAQYFQLIVGLTPLEAGLWSLPSTAAVLVGFTVAPLLARRFQPGTVAASGLLISAAGMALLTQAEGESGLAIVVTSQVLFFLGGSPLLVLGTDLVVGSAPPERAGGAAALSETAQEFGGALGLALFGSIAAGVYRAEFSGEADTLGAAVAAAETLPPAQATAFLDSARDAFTSGLQLTALASIVVVLIAAALSATLLRRAALPPQPEEASKEPAIV